MRAFLAIPVFDQVKQLRALLPKLDAARAHVETVLFIDDGSTDGSEKLLALGSDPVLTQPGNMGLGAALARAARWGLTQGFDVMAIMASNGKMQPDELGRVLGPVIRDEADFVTGSRFIPGGQSPNLPTFRKTVIPMGSAVVSRCFGQRITDITCGYRAFRLNILERANFDWESPWMRRYGFEQYLYAKVLMEPTLRAVEAPVTMAYPTRGPYSKIPPLVGWIDIATPWLRAAFDGKGFEDVTKP